MSAPDWHVFTGDAATGGPHRLEKLPPPPPWRDLPKRFDREGWEPEEYDAGQARDARLFLPATTPADRPEALDAAQILDRVNAAICLRRPLLVEGPPGVGKSSLATAIAAELGLGAVLRWNINTRSTRAEGLYRYDAIARLQDVNFRRDGDGSAPDPRAIERYLRLGPVGTALYPRPRKKPRVLLIDEIDKSDVDLPNDLLDLFEEGEFEIPELTRLARSTSEKLEFRVQVHGRSADDPSVPVPDGWVRCHEFPIVVMTSNGEREFPPAFLRRCVRVRLSAPDEDTLRRIIEAQFGMDLGEEADACVLEFVEALRDGHRATDQLLNAVYVLTQAGGDATLRDALYEEPR